MDDESYVANNRRSAAVDIVNTFVAHLALWIPAVGLVLFAPQFERFYRDFNIMLPWPTLWMINSGAPVFAPIMVVLLAADAPVLYFLNRGPVTKVASVLWSSFMVAVPLVLTLFAALAFWLPMLKIMEYEHVIQTQPIHENEMP
jgi:hypothetical protein